MEDKLRQIELTEEETKEIEQLLKDYEEGMFSDESYVIRFGYLMAKILTR